MGRLELFPPEQVVGVFRGFQEGGLEFHADLVLPYKSEFQTTPMHGQFVLVQLETPDEAVLGRISALHSEGKLASETGEEFNIRAARENRTVPEELRESYLKYRVNIRVLGVLRHGGDCLTFVPSHRRLPHVGSPVAFPSPDVLREIAGHGGQGAEVGYLALGEYIYAAGADGFVPKEWMQVRAPEVVVKFPLGSLVSRRSFVFARAGFGKSNLTKLLFGLLYQDAPTVEKRQNRRVPVGTVIFDPDGEYFWPDDKGRPGLCDVPGFEEKLVVFTSRHNASPFYQSFVAGDIKLDIRRLKPADVIAIALPPDRQEQQNVRKLRALRPESWERLVNLIDEGRHQTDLKAIAQLVGLEYPSQEGEALAARANVTSIVGMLHDRSSQLMDMVLHALSEGKLCVVDVSRLRSGQALVLSGLILNRIFAHNQDEFTKAQPATIPTIAVVEEAQSVLNSTATSADPFIAWVKEGRKYDLGAVLITQQPGSIPGEILSQGDNWFIFHLLAAEDLMNLKRANAHFSQDLLASLLNEPIEGQGVFWSSVAGKPYPVPIRVRSFEQMYPMLDPAYSRPAARTYAQQLRQRFQDQLLAAVHAAGDQVAVESDPLVVYAVLAERAIREDERLMARIQTDGVAWGVLNARIASALPADVDGRDDIAYRLVPRVMHAMFGKEGWDTVRRDGKTYIRVAQHVPR